MFLIQKISLALGVLDECQKLAGNKWGKRKIGSVFPSIAPPLVIGQEERMNTVKFS